MRQLSYLKAVVIVHGKSELQICKYVKNNLRLRIEIESEKNGEKAIQITSLMNLLNNQKFRTVKAFIRNFKAIDWNSEKKEINNGFKIFIIMDTDDCTKSQKKEFINKEMFKNHWAYDYIVPIYNFPKLETVLDKAGVPYEKTGDHRKEEYVKLFPTDKKYISKNDKVQISDLIKELSKNNDTNFEEFFKFCLEVK